MKALVLSQNANNLRIQDHFPPLYANNLSCELYSLHQDYQENLLSCVKLAGEVNIPNNIKYEDVYGSVDK